MELSPLFTLEVKHFLQLNSCEKYREVQDRRYIGLENFLEGPEKNPQRLALLETNLILHCVLKQIHGSQG